MAETTANDTVAEVLAFHAAAGNLTAILVGTIDLADSASSTLTGGDCVQGAATRLSRTRDTRWHH